MVLAGGLFAVLGDALFSVLGRAHAADQVGCLGRRCLADFPAAVLLCRGGVMVLLDLLQLRFAPAAFMPTKLPQCPFTSVKGWVVRRRG